MRMNFFSLSFFVLLLLSNQAVSRSQSGKDSSRGINNIPRQIAPFFSPPPELAHDFGKYRSTLRFYDGAPVKTPADWQKRRYEILKTWHGLMGAWPPLIKEPRIEYLAKELREDFTDLIFCWRRDSAAQLGKDS